MKKIFTLSTLIAALCLIVGCETIIVDNYMPAPTDVSASAEGLTSITLSYTYDGTDAQMVTAQLLTNKTDNPSTKDSTITKSVSAGKSITFTNLPTGKCYFIRVRVLYADGLSQWGVSEKKIKVGTGMVSASTKDDTTPAANQIFYTTADNRIIDISNYDSIGGSSILSNIYTNGIGIITCSEAINYISEQFNNESGITSVTLPEIDTIEHSFTGCESLSRFTYYHNGSLVTRNYLACKNWLVAYAPNNNNTTFTIPSNIEVLGYQAFRSCRNLESVTIHSNVFSVGGATFYWCSNLKEVYCQRTTPPSAEGSGLFEDCNQLKIYVPNSALNAYKEADGWRYYSDRIFADPSTLTNNKIYYTSTDGEIVNPYSSSAFNGNITSNTYSNGSGVITFDTDITTFGVEAFKNCTTLKTIQIPNGVKTIGTNAFYGCTALQNASIPSSVTTINSQAFYNCSSLATIAIPSSVTTIGNDAFNGCTSLTTVAIPSKVTAINSYTFYGCSSLTSVTIPDGITSIGSSAFYRCSSLTSIAIPSSVTSIGSDAFVNCNKLTRVDITSLEAWCNITFSSSSSNPLYASGGGIYLNDSLITDLVIPQSITKVKDYTFRRATSITSVTLHDNVTSIGSYAFYSCTALTSCDIPNGLTTINKYAFRNCSALTTITIPENVTSIGDFAFRDCSSLVSVYCKPITPPTLGGISVFDYNATDRKIYVPASSVDTYKTATNWSEYADAIVPDAISETYKIYYTTTDGNVVTPYQTTGFNANIASNTYENGQGVITFDAPLTVLGTYAFYNCTTLTSVTMPESVTTIDTYAFRNCTALISCNIPNGVTTIDNYAFQNCQALPNIAIPESVTSIGTGAFSSCTKLTRVDITSLAAWCNIAFSGTSSNPLYASGGEIYHNGHPIINLYIPEGVTEIKNYAFYKATSIASVTLHEKVTSIGSYAFRYCSALTSCDIPNGLTTIYSYAFGQCSALTTITIPESVTTIGNSAFYYCSSLTNVYCKPTTPPTLGGSSVFDSNATDRKIYVPASSADAYKTATNWSEYADAITADYSSETNKIYYTSSDGNVVTPNATNVFGANITSNTYENGQGVITFDGAVTSIGNKAFYYCSNLTSATIPDSVTSIGYDAFCGCRSLTSVTIPDSVTSIGIQAFSSCSSLTSVIIGNSVTSIGNSAFSNCYSLTSVTIPDSVTSIMDDAFGTCDNLAEFNGKFASADKRCLIVNGTLRSFAPAGLTEYTIPDSVTKIGWCIFQNYQSITSITIPNSVTSIGDGAFSNCGLTSVTIPDSVTSIKDGAFSSCDNLAEFNGKFASTDKRCLIVNGTLNSFAPAGLTGYTIPNSVTAIGNGAFFSCNKLCYVTIPDSVTSIGNQAFDYCSKLIEVFCKPTTPPTLGGTSVFYSYTTGRKIYVPAASVDAYKSAAYWSEYADAIVADDGSSDENRKIYYTTTDGNVVTLYQTTGFNANIVSNTYENGQGVITFDSLVTTIGTSAFAGCTTLSSITIPAGVTSIGGSAFQNCTSLPNITIPVGITSIGSSAFTGCSNLKSVYIDDLSAYCKISFSSTSSVPTYNSAKLYVKGTELTKLTIPEDVTTIKYATFYKCSSIKSVVIGNHVTSIENYTFRYCPAITSVKIGNGVTTIGNYAFANCTALESVTIGSGATKIGSGAFYNSTKLAVVRCKPTTPPTLSSTTTFDSNATDRVIYVPQAAVEAYQSATNWSEYASAIVADDNQVTPGDDINENQYPDEL